MSLFSFNVAEFYRSIAKALTHIIYRVEYIGFDKIPDRGPVLIIANHVSYVDGLLIQAGMKRHVRYLIDQFIYEVPGIHYIMSMNEAIPILPRKDSVEKALDEISEGLERGQVVAIFPEGQLTYTGNLGRFKPGVEWIIERDPVPIYPVAIKGVWGGIFSRKYLKSKYRWVPKGFRPKVTCICGDVIHPGTVRVDHLQRVILGLKNSIE